MSKRIEVNVTEGKLSGIVEESIYKDRYIAFRGIPYAAPPIGELRFQDPVPPKPWSGSRDASKFGNESIQIDFYTRELIGDEDCLFLNVYTLDVKPEKKRPVMVWIHGGSYVSGSGNALLYGPDYLIKRDIVLVTLNYRLGALGFLNLNHEKASGNQGLKDILMALRWLQQNISEFGGDPQNVTIFGESAGAATVHFLALSPLAEGLFHKAISQSGLATNPWAFTENDIIIERGLAIAKELGKATTDPKVAYEYLKTIDAKKLKEAELKVSEKCSGPPYELSFMISIDNKSQNPFFREHPNEYIRRGVKVPFLLGFTTREGGFIVRSNYYDSPSDETLKQVDSDFKTTIHPKILSTLPKIPITVEELKSLYFGNKAVSNETIVNYADFLTDVFFTRGIPEVLDVQIKNGTTYLYEFSYDSPTNMMRKIFNITIPGPIHLEDVCYLFYPHVIKNFDSMPPAPDSEDYKMMNRMTQMWTDFAKTGNPTPVVTDLTPIKWSPLKQGNLYDYLNIDIEPRMETFHKGGERWDWKKI